MGPPDSRGEELFHVTACSPEWLAARCRDVGLYDARHHLVVNVENFDKRELRRWLGRLRTEEDTCFHSVLTGGPDLAARCRLRWGRDERSILWNQ